MKYKIFTKDKIINLFSIFVIGTILSLIWLFLFFNKIYYWESILMIALFSISALFYLIILYSIMVYYFSRWGFLIFNKIDKNKETFIFGAEIFLGLLVMFGSGFLFKKYWIGVLISIPSVILIIAAMPPASDWIKKWYRRKRENGS